MTATLPALLLHAIALSAFGATAADASTVMKCGAPAGSPALVALDGEIVPITIDDVDREKALLVQVLCLGPDGSTFTREPTGRGLASVWTVDGPLPDMKPALEAIFEAQVAHYGGNGTYLESLDAIDLSEFHGDISLTLRTTSDGWIAVATVENLFLQCVVHEGDVADAHEGAVAGEPQCIDDQGYVLDW